MSSNTYSQFASYLAEKHQADWCRVPSPTASRTFLSTTLGVLFPHLHRDGKRSAAELEAELRQLENLLASILAPIESSLTDSAAGISRAFMERLPTIYEYLILDAKAIYQGDPAAYSVDEVILAYPGFFAIAAYRIAHEFYSFKVPIFPRVLTEIAHERTGIDIHPGASIGRSFFIDHGTGIVVGETTVIHDNVKLYQGVTLGALSVDKSKANTKRHPTIEEHAVIYSNATILGGETVVGHHSIIGGNVWVTASVPPNSKVYHTSDTKVKISE